MNCRRATMTCVDPKWKGKLGIEADDTDWFGAVIDQLGEERGLKLFRDIVATNGISVRKGHTLAGEPHHIRGSAARAHDLRLSGRANEEQRRAGRLVHHPAHHRALRRCGRCPPRRAPERRDPVLRFHADGRAGTPARSRLFSGEPEGQSRCRTGFALTFLDAARSLDENQKWSKYYRDTFISRAR